MSSHDEGDAKTIMLLTVNDFDDMTKLPVTRLTH